MSFILKEEHDPIDGKLPILKLLSNDKFPDTLREDLSNEVEVNRGPPVYEKDAINLIKVIHCLWISTVVFQTMNLVQSIFAAFKATRGNGWKTWLLWMMITNSIILCIAIALGCIGMRKRSTKILVWSSLTHYFLCCWCVVLWFWDFIFVLILSAKEGKYTSKNLGPQLYTPKQIAEFNFYILCVIILDAFVVLVSYISGRRLYDLAACCKIGEILFLEKKYVTENSVENEHDSKNTVTYGTFKILN